MWKYNNSNLRKSPLLLNTKQMKWVCIVMISMEDDPEPGVQTPEMGINMWKCIEYLYSIFFFDSQHLAHKSNFRNLYPWVSGSCSKMSLYGSWTENALHLFTPQHQAHSLQIGCLWSYKCWDPEPRSKSHIKKIFVWSTG